MKWLSWSQLPQEARDAFMAYWEARFAFMAYYPGKVRSIFCPSPRTHAHPGYRVPDELFAGASVPGTRMDPSIRGPPVHPTLTQAVRRWPWAESYVQRMCGDWWVSSGRPTKALAVVRDE